VSAPQTVLLGGVPETMLWPLHSRACEAMRPNGSLTDPDAVRIYNSIDYPFRRNFGRPDGGLAWRATIFDDHVRTWLTDHPNGTVVELACGLETQALRCDNGTRKWLSIDVPEAIDVRERFISASARSRHLAKSALDLSWTSEVDPSQGVCVTAQGLLMYLPEPEVERLVSAIFARWPSVTLVFDCIPKWLSLMSTRGFPLSLHYRSPPMPWGLQAHRVETTLKRWGASSVSQKSYMPRRGPLGVAAALTRFMPFGAEFVPTVVRAR
jgi:O-methyltransferase involved in polyketide biosynthesis